MGADYSAFAVIGCIVDLDKIPKKTERVKAFKHDFADNPEMQFDPKSGKKLYIEEEYPEYAFKDEGSYHEKTKVIDLKGMSFFRGTDGEPIILGAGIKDTYSNGGNEYDFMKLDDNFVANTKTKIKEILEPVGLWNEKEFGLYSILYCSY